MLDELAAKGEVQTHPPADPDEIDAFEREAGVRLPDAHRRLLLLTNGFEAFRGYFRMFGIGPDATIDMRTWNAPDLWKFAYQGTADAYLCFAELGPATSSPTASTSAVIRSAVPAYNLLANDMSEVILYPDFEIIPVLADPARQPVPRRRLPRLDPPPRGPRPARARGPPLVRRARRVAR